MKHIIKISLIIGMTSCHPVPANEVMGWWSIDQRELTCLAANIYHEARGDGLDSMIAVASVTMNRADHEAYPDDVCEVVFEKGQFSWTANPDAPLNGVEIRDAAEHCPTKHDIDSWAHSLDVAMGVYYNMIGSNVGESLFFHDKRYEPTWAGELQYRFDIGSHTFY